jgi:DeoR family glycerol-3-phosphate regulon repressor
MQPASTQQKEIMALARVQGHVSVDGLAEKFDVTPQTIRKVLNDLCEQRLLSRVHGGAIIASGLENTARSKACQGLP